MLSNRYQLLLIVTILLAIFYPSLSGELSSIDDVEMVTNVMNTGEWHLKNLFFPGAGGGLYYRPLLYLTYLIDNDLWFMEGRFLHLENILLHLSSAILVFFISRALLPAERRETSLIPLVTALCFGIHPIVTEPVNWVSGRTDLLAGVFVLASCLLLLKFKAEHQRKYLFVSLFALLLGMLSKEVALLFLPGGLLILLARNPEDGSRSLMVADFRQRVKRLLMFCLLGGGALALFFLMRSVAFSTNSSRIGMTIKFILNDPAHAVFVFLRALGFYCKKFFWPLPLNFAIVEVDPLYELLAIPIVFACLYICWRRTLLSGIFLSGMLLLVPSFPIAFGQIAWTPYAERYMYIATAFVTIASVVFWGTYLRGKNINDNWVKAGTLAVMFVMCIGTFQRNVVWRTNISLFTDTAEKSPTFTKAWNQLGIAYHARRDLANAERFFAKASSLYEMSVDEKSDLNLAVVLVEQGKIKEAEKVYADVFAQGGYKSAKVVEHYTGYLTDKAAKEKDPAAVAEIKKEILSSYKKLYVTNKDPALLLKVGNLQNILGDKRSARASYLTAYEMFPENDKNRQVIKTHLAQLGVR
jgi:protein O-mannosyl-transferase